MMIYLALAGVALLFLAVTVLENIGWERYQ